MKVKNTLLGATILAASASAVQAVTVLSDVTYVDAAEANTGPIAEIRNTAGTWVENSASRKTGFWDYRVGETFGFNGNTLEAGDGTADNPRAIILTIPGLAPGGVYEITGFYSIQNALDWEIYMGLTSDSLTKFDKTNGLYLTPGDVAFSNELTVTTEADLVASYYGVLGLATADGGGNISVSVHHTGDGDVPTERAWFDGAGYKAVPEPGSAILLSISSLGMILRRRR